MSVISAERLSSLLGHIYDCVLQPEKWDIALGAVCRELRLLHAVIGYYQTPTGKPLLRIQHGMAREWFDKMPEYGPDMATYWGGAETIRGYPLGEVIAHSIAQPDMDVRQNRFVREWCQPQGIVDLVALSISVDPTGLSSLVFTSQRKFASAVEQELDVLRLIAPHVRRVITISKLLDLKSIEAANFEATLKALPNGIVLLDADTRVVHANAAAEALLASRDVLRVVNGKLTLHDDAATHALAEAVSASANAATLGQRGIGVPARSLSGAGSILHVLPLDQGSLRQSLNPRAVAALFITSAQSRPKLPGDALSMLYDLTPAEVRICELIADGLSLADIAHRIGVAHSTAKTHLLRVFEKTGTNRQADLVRLCASLSMS